MHPNWMRLILLLGFAQLAALFHSTRLLLWPLRHSCARPGNLSNLLYHVEDSRSQPIDMDAIQTDLFDATPEDAFTAARASAMGFNYDDISSCLQHPVEYNTETGSSTVNIEALETCPFGLRFEDPNHELSVVGLFSLACGRQWMKILLPQSIALGILLGILMTRLNHHFYPDFSADQSRRSPSGSFIWWLSLIVMACFLRETKYKLHERGSGSPAKEGFVDLLISALLLSFTLGCCLARILLVWKLERGQSTRSSGNYLNFLLIILLFQAAFLPVALRLFSNWLHLIDWLSHFGYLFVAFTICGELWSYVNIQLFCSGSGSEVCQSEESFLEQIGVPEYNCEKDSHSEFHNSHVSVCEFCLLSSSYPGDLRGIVDKKIIDVQQDYYLPHLAAYVPTTAPLHSALTLPSASDQQPTERLSAPWRQHAHIPLFHNLFGGRVKIELWTLTFCLTFNYFLLQQMPDHRLIHEESIASRYERKISLIQSHRAANNSNLISSHEDGLHQGTQLIKIFAGNEKSSLIATGKREALGAKTKGHQQRKSSFDYRSLNYATSSVEFMLNSSNPLEIIGITCSLNGWPVDLIVILLHVDSLSAFAANYFKPNRLFRLITFGSLLLTVEWLTLGLFRGHNHLLEVSWVLNGALLLARFGSSLAAYSYFHTMLKIGCKLRSDRLIGFTSSATCASMAYILACLAPVLEKQDLLIMPMAMVANNIIVYLIARDLGKKFQRFLCPMMFNEFRAIH